MSSNSWLPESATEWIASANIEDAPVIAKAMNLDTAIPRLAHSAATTALVPSFADIGSRSGGGVTSLSCPTGADPAQASLAAYDDVGPRPGDEGGLSVAQLELGPVGGHGVGAFQTQQKLRTGG